MHLTLPLPARRLPAVCALLAFALLPLASPATAAFPDFVQHLEDRYWFRTRCEGNRAELRDCVYHVRRDAQAEVEGSFEVRDDPVSVLAAADLATALALADIRDDPMEEGYATIREIATEMLGLDTVGPPGARYSVAETWVPEALRPERDRRRSRLAVLRMALAGHLGLRGDLGGGLDVPIVEPPVASAPEPRELRRPETTARTGDAPVGSGIFNLF